MQSTPKTPNSQLRGEAPRPNTEYGESDMKAADQATPDSLSIWMRSLESLPSASDMWDSAIPDFSERLSSLIAEKAVQREVAVRLKETIAEITEPGQLSKQLADLNLSAEGWADFELGAQSSASEALRLAEDLKSALTGLAEHLTGSDSNIPRIREYAERVKSSHGGLNALLTPPSLTSDEPPHGANAPAKRDAPADSDVESPQSPGAAPTNREGASPASLQSHADEGVDEQSEAERREEKPDDAHVPPDSPADDSGGGEEIGSGQAPQSEFDDAKSKDAELGGEKEDEGAVGGPQDHFPSSDDVEAAMWEMVAEDDLSGAHWVAKSLEAGGGIPSALPHLLAAAQGARWLSPDSDAYAEELFEIVENGASQEKGDAQSLLRLAAALQASIMKPETNLTAWLETPEICGRLNEIVSGVRESMDWGILPITPEDIGNHAKSEEFRQAVSAASVAARVWLADSANYSYHIFPPATAVFKALRADGGELHELLSPVARDFRKGADAVRIQADKFGDESFVRDLINRTDRRTGGGSWKPIDGRARNWLVSNVQEAVDKAKAWLNHVERENKLAPRGNLWRMERVANLIENAAANSDAAFAALNELSANPQTLDIASSAQCVARSLKSLLDYLNIDIPESAEPLGVSAAADGLRAVNAAPSSDDRLETAMGRRLIWLPSAKLDDACVPRPGVLAELGAMLLESGRAPVSLFDALKRRVEEYQDYRFYDAMRAALPQSRRGEMELIREKRRGHSEDALEDEARNAQDALRQAVRDGVLEFDDNEWETLNGEVDSFISDDGAIPNHAVDDFLSAHAVIENVRDRLSGMRGEKLGELRQDWDKLLGDAKETAKDDESVLKTWEDKFNLAESEKDLRVMELCAAWVNGRLNGGERLMPASDFDASHGAGESFAEFLRGVQDPKAHARDSSALRALANELATGASERNVDQLGSVGARGDSERALNSWIALRAQPRQSRVRTQDGAADAPGPRMVERVGATLNFLGLPYHGSAQFRLRGSGRGDNWAHLTFESEPTEFPKGAPLFGAQANGVYHVFCLWEPRPDRIWFNALTEVAEGSQNAVIALYLDALTASERNEIKRRSWRDNLSVAVVDEMLMEFLARRGGGEFGDFLEAALPYSDANPYNPVTTGWGARVSPEMFYGRERTAREIHRMRDGNCIIFGGRQLGKTSLLQHVRNQFHRPDENRFAWFIDLKDKGFVSERDKPSEDINAVILGEFLNDNLISPEEAEYGANDINLALRRVFQKNPQLRVLAMFDESDAFLEKDAENGFRAIESMRVAMRDGDIGGRFKVVFAGLHSVQRYACEPNSPFQNLGFDPNSPRRGGIGPLLYGDARKLVEEPLRFLGFRLDELVADRILSYTHCHPSLTQFFCHQLIQTFREENADASPPFAIRGEDVDRVYRMSNIQNGVKRRFEATFELDSKYHAICLAMLYDQTQDSGRVRQWRLDDVRDSCGEWWPDTFGDGAMRENDLKSLLDELIGLGILVGDGSAYRMRSPLIARMFGSENQILDSIEKLDLK